MKSCAVIPAAGLGTRLGLDRPKILAPLTAGETIWSVLRRKLLAVVDHIHVVLSPEGEKIFREVTRNDLSSERISVGIQPVPSGMGDAIFCGYDVWSTAKILLVIWGDQVFVADRTLSEAIALHHASPRTLVLPLFPLPEPYVEYVFDPNGRLVTVRQSREGDRCSPGGLNDVGTFVLSVDGLKEAWDRYILTQPRGRETREINFLPFLPFLSNEGWEVRRFVVSDSCEARGINTADDLRFFQALYAPDVGPAES